MINNYINADISLKIKNKKLMTNKYNFLDYINLDN